MDTGIHNFLYKILWFFLCTSNHAVSLGLPAVMSYLITSDKKTWNLSTNGIKAMSTWRSHFYQLLQYFMYYHITKKKKHLKITIGMYIILYPTYQTELTQKEWPIIKLFKSILQVIKLSIWCRQRILVSLNLTTKTVTLMGKTS